MQLLSESRLYMVFDVESIGLHGEGFAYGFVVVRGDGTLIAEGQAACPPITASGDDEGRQWVAANCPTLPATCTDPKDLRRLFWHYWMEWKEQHAALVADCAWPVEARFLAACVDDEPENLGRPWQGPYPLHELASIRLAAGLDPLGSNARHNDELPEHDPLADARQSARLLITALGVIEAKGTKPWTP